MQIPIDLVSSISWVQDQRCASVSGASLLEAQTGHRIRVVFMELIQAAGEQLFINRSLSQETESRAESSFFSSSRFTPIFPSQSVAQCDEDVSQQPSISYLKQRFDLLPKTAIETISIFDAVIESDRDARFGPVTTNC